MTHRIFPVIAVLFATVAPAHGESPARPAAGTAARPAKSGGVSVEFQERKLPEADRTPLGELNAILASSATLKLDRPIRYRSTVLAAGSYRVMVVADEQNPAGRNLYFIIGPAGAPPGSGSPAPEEKKGGEKEGSPAPKATGAGAGAAKQSPGVIKALFHLAPATRASESVQFTVRPTARGDRFTLQVAAGSSQGKATLRFADATEGAK